MNRTGRKKEWSIALFCAGLLFLFPPILTIFDKSDFVFGLPLTYVVLYGFWALVIAAVAYISRQKPDDEAPEDTNNVLDRHQGER